jgi:hypothetical protein
MFALTKTIAFSIFFLSVTRFFFNDVSEFSSSIRKKFSNFLILKSYNTSFDDKSIDALTKLFNDFCIEDMILMKSFFFH